MPRMLPDADKTAHVTFSLFPSTIYSIRNQAGRFGSVGRAVQVAVEVLYAMRDRKDGMLNLEEAPVPSEVEDAYLDNRETYIQKALELKAAMSCNLHPRTRRLIAELAKPEYYRDRYLVIMAVEMWLARAMSDEQSAMARKQREEEEQKMDPEIRRSQERAGKEFW